MSGIPLARHSPPTACKRVVSGTISLPSQGFFSPFPHGTGSLSVANWYLALPDGPGRFPQGSTCPAVLRSRWKEDCIFTYGAVTLYGRPFQTVQLMHYLSLFSFAGGGGRRPEAGVLFSPIPDPCPQTPEKFAV